MKDLKGKKAVISGGNSGIGYATAKVLKEYGAEVIITGRNKEKVTLAAEELGVKGLVADVSNLQALDNLVAEVQSTFGKVDVLFVNAGVYAPTALGQLSEEQFDYQTNINYKGAVFTLEKFLPILNDGSSVVNLSSVLANMGMAGTAVYGATKAALNAFTKIAATELAPRGIRVNSINPGPIETPIFSKSGLSEEELHGMAQGLQQRVPLSRFGKPEEVGKLVAYLSSDNAGFITGSEFNIDGGVQVAI